MSAFDPKHGHDWNSNLRKAELDFSGDRKAGTYFQKCDAHPGFSVRWTLVASEGVSPCYEKIYFQPDVNLDLAIAQIVSATNAIRALLPPGIQPPIVVQFNASSVPVLQIDLSSDSLNEQQLYDYGIYRIRQQLAPIQGVTLPTPAGGKYRQIMVDLDPEKLLATGLTPLDVVNAVNTQNLTLPSGTAKVGDTQYTVQTNATPATIDDLNNIPVKFANGATVFVKDVAQVRDGSAVQQNIVRADGKRSVLLKGSARCVATSVHARGTALARCASPRPKEKFSPGAS
jgi:Cu/Ag efflux pump CusA